MSLEQAQDAINKGETVIVLFELLIEKLGLDKNTANFKDVGRELSNCLAKFKESGELISSLRTSTILNKKTPIKRGGVSDSN